MGLKFPPSGFTDRTAARAGVRYASWLRRLGGLVVDGLIIGMIRYLVWGLFSYVLSPISNQYVVRIVFAGTLGAIAVVYATLCLWKLEGQTPGMRVLQIRCVHASDRRSPTLAQALTRSLTAGVVLTLPWMLSFYRHWTWLAVVPVLAVLWPLIAQRRQTWWDVLAATVVLDDRGY